MTRPTHSSRLLGFWVAFFALTLCAQPPPPPPITADLLFTHARLLDGSGNPWRWADVAARCARARSHSWACPPAAAGGTAQAGLLNRASRVVLHLKRVGADERT